MEARDREDVDQTSRREGLLHVGVDLTAPADEERLDHRRARSEERRGRRRNRVAQRGHGIGRPRDPLHAPHHQRPRIEIERSPSRNPPRDHLHRLPRAGRGGARPSRGHRAGTASWNGHAATAPARINELEHQSRLAERQALCATAGSVREFSLRGDQAGTGGERHQRAELATENPRGSEEGNTDETWIRETQKAGHQTGPIGEQQQESAGWRAHPAEVVTGRSRGTRAT